MSQATAIESDNPKNDVVYFGFWAYLMTDCVLFATLFATYAVLHNNTANGPASHEIFNMPYVLIETLLLLTSSFTCGLSMLTLKDKSLQPTLLLLGITFLLGLAFVGMELSEFAKLAAENNNWQRSGFLSSFFTLVGTHGLHITAGLLWLTVMGIRLFRRGLTAKATRQLTMFSMFWHFLDVVWVFIFTIVYLMGVA